MSFEKLYVSVYIISADRIKKCEETFTYVRNILMREEQKSGMCRMISDFLSDS